MQQLLSKMIGRKVDILCGGMARLRGEIVKVEGSVLHLKDEDGQMCYVAVEKIAAVWEVRDDEKRAGFFFSSPPNNR